MAIASITQRNNGYTGQAGGTGGYGGMLLRLSIRRSTIAGQTGTFVNYYSKRGQPKAIAHLVPLSRALARYIRLKDLSISYDLTVDG